MFKCYNICSYLHFKKSRKGVGVLSKKKQPVTLNLNKNTVEKLDKIRKQSKVHTTRTMLIEDILDQFVDMYDKFDWYNQNK
jgi:metal-responsive CopG/Arc/MetJ family transcriptional regulator